MAHSLALRLVALPLALVALSLCNISCSRHHHAHQTWQQQATIGAHAARSVSSQGSHSTPLPLPQGHASALMRPMHDHALHRQLSASAPHSRDAHAAAAASAGPSVQATTSSSHLRHLLSEPRPVRGEASAAENPPAASATDPAPLWHTLQLHAHAARPPPPSPPPAVLPSAVDQRAAGEAGARTQAQGPAGNRKSASTSSLSSSSSSASRRDPSKSEPITDEGSAAALSMDWHEAAAAAELFFLHLLPPAASGQPSSATPSSADPASSAAAEAAAAARLIPELQQGPEAVRLMSFLRRIWQAHSSAPGSAAAKPRSARVPEDHCSTPGGAQLLQQAAEAARALGAATCSNGTAAAAAASGRKMQAGRATVRGTAAAPGAAGAVRGMPFVVLRRMSMLVLQLAHQQAAAGGNEQGRQACHGALSKATPDLLLSFASAFNCSRVLRPAMELLHISKSGGTSMCQLAKAVGLRNPSFSVHGNCLIPPTYAKFHDEPKWTRVEDFIEPLLQRSMPTFWPAANCTIWVQEHGASCARRAKQLLEMGVNFYANEQTLHGGDGTLGSAMPCAELETVTVLREPVERARSHVIETNKVYEKYVKYSNSFKRDRDLVGWQRWAPAVLDNYMTRSLLGRHHMCRDFGAIGVPELLTAARALTSFDHILLLEEGNLNEVVMRAGMGWNSSFRSRRSRWSVDHDLHRNLGFPPDSMQLLQQWNLQDQDLYLWGRVLLRLDAAFHSAVAQLTGRLQQSGCGPAATSLPQPKPESQTAATAPSQPDRRRPQWRRSTKKRRPARRWLAQQPGGSASAHAGDGGGEQQAVLGAGRVGLPRVTLQHAQAALAAGSRRQQEEAPLSTAVAVAERALQSAAASVQPDPSSGLRQLEASAQKHWAGGYLFFKELKPAEPPSLPFSPQLLPAALEDLTGGAGAGQGVGCEPAAAAAGAAGGSAGNSSSGTATPNGGSTADPTTSVSSGPIFVFRLPLYAPTRPSTLVEDYRPASTTRERKARKKGKTQGKKTGVRGA